MTTAYISHDDCLLHEMGPYHQESSERLTAINRGLADTGLDDLLWRQTATPITAPAEPLFDWPSSWTGCRH